MQLTAAFDRRAPREICHDPDGEWNGQTYRVTVADGGFAWNGKNYDSLSKVAFAITGTKWNGPRFFGLRDETFVETTA